MATEAGIDAFNAVTLSDAEVKELAVKASRHSDRQHRVAADSSKYSIRLQRLVGKHQKEGEHVFNYKVYISDEINAFAMADGTIRIHSKLMDIMDDGELRFIIGHEMGHVVKKHIRNKIMLAYAGSALRKTIASQENLAGDIARSSIGGFTEKLLNAQFSQQEEQEADDYGLLFLKRKGYDTGSAVSALRKLAASGGSHSIFSSHPEPESRADRIEKQHLLPVDSVEASSWDIAIGAVTKLFNWLKDLVLSFL